MPEKVPGVQMELNLLVIFIFFYILVDKRDYLVLLRNIPSWVFHVV